MLIRDGHIVELVVLRLLVLFICIFIDKSWVVGSNLTWLDLNQSSHYPQFGCALIAMTLASLDVSFQPINVRYSWALAHQCPITWMRVIRGLISWNCIAGSAPFGVGDLCDVFYSMQLERGLFRWLCWTKEPPPCSVSYSMPLVAMEVMQFADRHRFYQRVYCAVGIGATQLLF